MGKIERLIEGTEVAAPILGCSNREDCEAPELPMKLFTTDALRLDRGIEAANGLTVEMLLQDRVTFMGMCNPAGCERTGKCALRGTFVPTTPEMIVAQDCGSESIRLGQE